ncbi:MAG: hypothetical protein ACOZNI_33125 [Myxococcota bacterium]
MTLATLVLALTTSAEIGAIDLVEPPQTEIRAQADAGARPVSVELAGDAMIVGESAIVSGQALGVLELDAELDADAALVLYADGEALVADVWRGGDVLADLAARGGGAGCFFGNTDPSHALGWDPESQAGAVWEAAGAGDDGLSVRVQPTGLDRLTCPRCDLLTCAAVDGDGRSRGGAVVAVRHADRLATHPGSVTGQVLSYAAE